MRKVIVLLSAVLVLGRVHSQTFVGVQWQVAEPTQGFRLTSATGFGAKVTYIRFLGPAFALCGSFGHIKFDSRVNTPPLNDYKFVVIPVHVGMKLLLSKGVVSTHIGFDLGMDYLRIRGVPPTSVIPTFVDMSELKFGFSPEIGVGIHVAGPVGVLLTGSYNVVYTQGDPSQYFGLGAGLAVGF